MSNNPNSFVDPLGLLKCAVNPDNPTQPLPGQFCSTSGDVWFGIPGDSWYGFQSGVNVGVLGLMPCSSDVMPCGALPTNVSQVGQSVWSDVLGLPSNLNCPQVGGLSNFICGGVSPIMDLTNNGMPGCTDKNSSLIDKGIQTFSLMPPRLREHWKEWTLTGVKVGLTKWLKLFRTPKHSFSRRSVPASAY